MDGATEFGNKMWVMGSEEKSLHVANNLWKVVIYYFIMDYKMPEWEGIIEIISFIILSKSHSTETLNTNLMSHSKYVVKLT